MIPDPSLVPHCVVRNSVTLPAKAYPWLEVSLSLVRSTVRPPTCCPCFSSCAPAVYPQQSNPCRLKCQILSPLCPNRCIAPYVPQKRPQKARHDLFSPPPTSLPSSPTCAPASHTGLLLTTSQEHSLLRAFTPAVPSVWTVLPHIQLGHSHFLQVLANSSMRPSSLSVHFNIVIFQTALPSMPYPPLPCSTFSASQCTHHLLIGHG